MQHDMNERTCIVTRLAGPPDEMIRFVVGPDSSVVPDIKRTLPGRGCWVTAERSLVEKAARKNLFARAFRRAVTVPADLADMIEAQLVRAVIGALGLARKAGALVTGATKVEQAVRARKAAAVLHAREAALDGVRKIAQARRVAAGPGGEPLPDYNLLSESELGLALGGTNVIHAAVLAGQPGEMVLKRLDALGRYRGESPENRRTSTQIGAAFEAAEDTE